MQMLAPLLLIVGLSVQAAQPTSVPASAADRQPDPVVQREREAALSLDVLAKCRANDHCLYLDLAKPFPNEELLLDLEKASEDGRADALYRLGAIKLSSDSTREDGLNEIRNAAEKGSPLAQNHWAYILLKEKKDSAGATEWWRKARLTFTASANAGDLDAMYALGASAPPADIKDSTDFPQTPKDQALKWLQRSAAGGNLDAIVKLAKMLGEDSASKSDQEASWKYYCEAAEAGYWRAMADMGILYEFGYSKWKPSLLTKNHTKAWEVWDRAILIAGESDFYGTLPLSKEELPPRPKKK